MNDKLKQLLKEQYGDRATDSQFECSLYQRDLGPVPNMLVNPLFNTKPDLVLRPQTEEEIEDLLILASQNDIPITPRAGASTVFFNAVPVQGGIVVDLNLLKGIVGFDQNAGTVTVKAATTFSEVEEYLEPKGFTLKTFPSSAPVATVAGWLSMMGQGIGSIKYGDFASQVKSLRVVLPSGEIKDVTKDSDPPLDWFAYSEGTLGIITQVEFEVRKVRPMKHFLLKFFDINGMFKAISQLAESSVVPYNLHFSEINFNFAMYRLGFIPDSLKDGYLVQVDFEGSDHELKQAENLVTKISTENNGELLPGELAAKEWEENCFALRIKRGGPAVLGSEIWLPINGLESYLEDIRKMSNKYNVNLKSYGHVVTPDSATVMTLFYADETNTKEYILNLSLVKKINDVGYKYGGHPYGVGLWNTPYLKRIFVPKELQELRARKLLLDKKGYLNPGKKYHWPKIMNPVNFGIGMELLAGLRRVIVRGDS